MFMIQQVSKTWKNFLNAWGVLGGGLEFTGLYNKLGSQVTVLDAAPVFLPRVEPSIAALAKQYAQRKTGSSSYKCSYHTS